MIKNYLVSLMIAFVALPAHAASSESYSTGDPRSSLSTIFYTGVGGAVLGLSTLSFYGRPEKHLPNIAIGFAVGIICGAGYVTVETAHHSSQPSSAAQYTPTSELEMSMNSDRVSHRMTADLAPAQWSWSF